MEYGFEVLQNSYCPKFLYEVAAAKMPENEDAHASWLKEEALAGLEMMSTGAIDEYNECEFVSNRLDQSDRSLYGINQLIETKNRLLKN